MDVGRVVAVIVHTSAPPASIAGGLALNLITGNNLWFAAGGLLMVITSYLADRFVKRETGRTDLDWFGAYTPSVFRHVARDTGVSWKLLAAPSWALVLLLALGFATLVVLGSLGIDTDGA